MTAHGFVYRLSSGRVGGKIGHNRVAVLTTTGRSSGRERQAPVFAYQDGNDYLVVASNGGTARPPQWFENLLARPEGWLEVGTERWPVRAVMLGQDERSTWWEVVAGSYPSYRTYQSRTDRLIPIVRLTPAAEDER